MAPILGKRPSPDLEDSVRKQPSKKQKVDSNTSPTPTLKPVDEDIIAQPTPSPLYDDEPRQLLRRSIALALEHVGFSGASVEAMEAMCSEVDAYASHFLSGITQSMLNARRSQPTPLDFQHALYRFDLPILSLRPHGKPPIPPSKVQPKFEHSASVSQAEEKLNPKFPGPELSGEEEKNEKVYIPKKFPSFPSKHTYKWTETFPERPNPRKIREDVAITARFGEEALRRFVKVSKAAKEKDVKNAASKDPRSKERHEMWEMAMGELSAGMATGTKGLVSKEEDRSMIVNAESQYFRKAIIKKRKSETAPTVT